MQSTAAAQKNPPQRHAACTDAFHSSFYTPYEAAVCTLLPILCAARSALCRAEEQYAVEAVTFRLKSPASIREKLSRKGLPACESSARTALSDIAGLRMVLSCVSAVYRCAEIIKHSPGVECFAEHDYIASPKKSGYQSLHLLLRVPVCLHGEALMIPVELQLRTRAMDVWANIEHALCYKPIK